MSFSDETYLKQSRSYLTSKFSTLKIVEPGDSKPSMSSQLVKLCMSLAQLSPSLFSLYLFIQLALFVLSLFFDSSFRYCLFNKVVLNLKIRNLTRQAKFNKQLRQTFVCLIFFFKERKLHVPTLLCTPCNVNIYPSDILYCVYCVIIGLEQKCF